MKRSEQVELTVLCLLRQGDCLLLQNRVKEDWRGYALPGGHVEPGESIVDAVVREMREETGLTVRQPRLCGVKQFPTERGRYVVFLFLSEDFEGTLRSSAEGEMRWVRRSELPLLSTVEDLDVLLNVMEREDLTEFQYVIRNGAWDVELR